MAAHNLLHSLGLPAPTPGNFPNQAIREEYAGFLEQLFTVYEDRVVLTNPYQLSTNSDPYRYYESFEEFLIKPNAWYEALPATDRITLLILSAFATCFDRTKLWLTGQRRFIGNELCGSYSLSDGGTEVPYGIGTESGRRAAFSEPGLQQIIKGLQQRQVLQTYSSELISEAPGCYNYTMWQICEWSDDWAIVFLAANVTGETPHPWLLGFCLRDNLERNFIELLRAGTQSFDWGLYSTGGALTGKLSLAKIALTDNPPDGEGADWQLIDELLAMDTARLDALLEELSREDPARAIERIASLQEQATELEMDEPTLDALLARSGPAERPLANLEKFLTAVGEEQEEIQERLALEREKLVAPFRDQINAWSSDAAGKSPTSFAAGMAHARRRSLIVQFLEDYVIKNGELPKGETDIPGFGKLDFTLIEQNVEGSYLGSS